jgi:nitrate/nitrite transport system substrate-binding protein
VVPDPAQALGPAQEPPDYLAVAKQINRIDLYSRPRQLKVSVPKDHAHQQADRRRGVGRQGPAKYADSFKIKA